MGRAPGPYAGGCVTGLASVVTVGVALAAVVLVMHALRLLPLAWALFLIWLPLHFLCGVG